MGEALARHPQKGVDSPLFCKVHQDLAAGENVPRFTEYDVPGFQARDPSHQYSKGDDALTCHDLDEEGTFDTDVAGQEFLCLHEVCQGTVHGVVGWVGPELGVARQDCGVCTCIAWMSLC